MNAPENRTDSDHVALVQLLPNLVTITALCAGLTSIRFAFHENFELSVQLILVAALLDGLDGRLARILKSDSKLGAELDSLVDFVNFGVAPAFVLYFWALQAMPSEGWIAVLIFVICCVLRLARFNVNSKADAQTQQSGNFVGVPAPAGAMLVMLPMFLSFTMANEPIFPGRLIAGYMILIGMLLISRIPTPSFKTARISRANAKFFIVGFAFTGAAVLTYPWTTLVVLTLVYVLLVIRNFVRVGFRGV
jgi:CDP-diacylglycerol--serine O-phosphatidyltransferase